MDGKNNIVHDKIPLDKLRKGEYRHGRNGKFNGVDVMILFLVLVFIAFAAYVMLSGGSTVSHFLSSVFNKGSEDAIIRYTVSIENCDKSIAESVAIGDSVYVGDFLVGSVAEVPIAEPCLVADGEYTVDSITGEKDLVMSQYGDRVNLKIVILADADYIKNVGVTVNSVRIASGAEYEFRSSGFSATGKCVSLVITQD